MADHYLTSYQKAISSVLAVQFGRKSLMHGRDGVLSLAQQRGERGALGGACGRGQAGQHAWVSARAQ